jgi:type II secretory pathway component PulF
VKVFTLKNAKKLLPKRNIQSNKSTSGRSLIIAGSAGMYGAAVLAARAAARSGSGYVQLLTDARGFNSYRYPDFLIKDLKNELKIPVIGMLLRYVYIARFADNLSALLSSGIPVVRALHIVSDVVGNTVYQSVILRAADEVKTGKTISSVFARSADIPPIVSRMLMIGEETGKMNHVLDSTSRFYSQEVDNITRNMTSLIEPILIVFLGIGVGILVVSVIMPIYNITGSIQ